MKKDVLQRIKELEISKYPILDLSGTQLTSLPPEISNLTNLTELFLSRTQLTFLPPEISYLTNLTRLGLFGTQLTSLPPEISHLTNLTELFLSHTQLTSLPPEISQLKNLTRLSLSGTQLTSLPPEFSHLSNLIELDLSHTQLTSLPPEISHLMNLIELDLSHTQLTSLPPEISHLMNLIELDLSHTQLTSLPSEISQLKNLTRLSLSGTQLTSLPPEFSHLSNLIELNLSGTQLTSLPPEISHLMNLIELDLSYTQLTSLPPEISYLTNLIELALSHTQLTSLPPEILYLTNLTRLDLSHTQLTSLPPEILYLTNLTRLDLSSTQLTSLPPEILYLTNLTRLDLSSTQLTSLPPEISHLTNLTRLYLSGTQLTSLPPEISHLTNLTGLNLSDNQLSSLPTEIIKLDLEIKWETQKYFNGIILKNNPFENPPIDIIKKGKNAVIEYFKSLEGEKQALNEVKVLLVGDGGSGKTSLLNQLLGEVFNKSESQTHGINIKQWEVKEEENKIKVHLWDFGGQEIMHATHQFFLSKRSLYILVLDGRKEEKIEYWLKHIESFGGDSPVLVVLNKIDENPAFEVNGKFLQEKYPSIKGFYRISCKDRRGIENFLQNLKKQLTIIEHLKTTWAKSWFNIKTQLENINDNFISYSKYVEMCNKENITEKSAQEALVDFLNDLGVILHFKNLELLDTHVLEPKWVTEAVYRIINSEKLANEKGVLKLKLLDEILKKEKETDYYYPREKFMYIVNLMKKFELCFGIDNQTVLIPDLLEIQEPIFNFNDDDSIKFLIDYDNFLPKSIMPRFLVKMHKDIKNKLRWRTGVVLEDPSFQSTALIKSDNDANKIYIYVNGKQKRDYFSVILSNFREINQSFEKIKSIEKVRMPSEPEITVSYMHLIRLEIKGIEKYIPDGSENEYNVKDLLGTIYVEKKNEEEILQILKEIRNEFDNDETFIRKVNDIALLQPNFMGVGVNLNQLIKKVLDKK